jgi:hypothetical protein
MQPARNADQLSACNIVVVVVVSVVEAVAS